jgi:hypothetical protein
MLIDKYIQIFDDFRINYANEIKYIRANIDTAIAKIDLGNGRNREARARLIPHIHLGYKYMLLYLLSFFPSRVYEILKRWRGTRAT